MLKRFCRAAIFALAVATAAQASADTEDGSRSSVPLTVVSFSTPDSAHGRRWVQFEREIRATLADQVTLSMLTGGEIGSEDTMLSGLRRGRVHMGIISVGGLSPLVPELGLLAAPFLFESEAEADFVMDHFVFDAFADLLTAKGLTLVKWEEGGWHQLYARNALVWPQDAESYKLRSPATDATRLFLSAVDADVVVLDFGDIVTSMQTGLVDGGVTTPVMYRAAGLYESAPHLTATNHAFAPGAMLANSAWVETVPTHVYDQIVGALGTTDDGRQAVRAEAAESQAYVAARGAQIHRLSPNQVRAWTEAARPVHQALISQIGGRAAEVYSLIQDGKSAFAERATKSASGTSP